MQYPHLGAANKDLEFIKKFNKEKVWQAPTFQGRPPFLPGFNLPAVSAREATHMRDEDCVIGVTVKGKSRAYPYWISDKFHTINDTMEGERILVTN